MTHQTLKTGGGICQSERHDPIRLDAPFGCIYGFTLIIWMYLHLIVTTNDIQETIQFMAYHSF